MQSDEFGTRRRLRIVRDECVAVGEVEQDLLSCAYACYVTISAFFEKSGLLRAHQPTTCMSFLPCRRSSQRSAALPRPIVSSVMVPFERTTMRVLIRRPRM